MIPPGEAICFTSVPPIAAGLGIGCMWKQDDPCENEPFASIICGQVKERQPQSTAILCSHHALMYLTAVVDELENEDGE